ncbi:MAG: hypothetical protein IMZ43_01515 [Thermoplasmata archaeon]|nr:hypothetical protein [Thermoplasmata archaeon]
MATRRSLTDYQQAGFGGLSFATNLNFMNLPLSYEQRLWALEGLFACALAKIEDDTKYKDDREIGLLVGGIRIMLDQAGKDYVSRYESHQSFDKAENDYRALLSQTFSKILELQGKTKMIERNYDEGVMMA